MPKKVHGRPAKAKTRPRRTTSTNSVSSPGNTLLEEPVETGVTSAPVTTPYAPTAAPTVAPRGSRPLTPSAPTTRRTPAVGRKAPATVVNYQYLRRDITALLVLAPAMVIILFLAFIVLH